MDDYVSEVRDLKERGITLGDIVTLSKRLQHMPRMYQCRAGEKNPQSVAEHSYLTAMLAMVYWKFCTQDFDLGRVLMGILLHDLPEAIFGDRMRDGKTKENNEQENKVLIDMVKCLGIPIWADPFPARAYEPLFGKRLALLDNIELLLGLLDYQNDKYMRMVYVHVRNYLESPKFHDVQGKEFIIYLESHGLLE